MLQQELEMKRAELLDRLERLEREQQMLSLGDERVIEEFRGRIEELRREAAALTRERAPNAK